MNPLSEITGTGPCWFMGASYGRTEDQTNRFLEQGIWENGYEDKYLELVKSIPVGARIAIKASFTRKHSVPYNNEGKYVSVMAIKAIGNVTENPGDGRRLTVDWNPVHPQLEWYFYTNRNTVWKVSPDNWKSVALIGFTFSNESQDIERFLRDLEVSPVDPAQVPYSKEDLVAEGCFAELSIIETMLERLQSKKNLILQGPPGTGKTWLAKRLGFALIGHRDYNKVRAVQFHPNSSYEDFIRGWRPAQGGRLNLVDGPFLELANDAIENPDTNWVLVIEEINRGNPAQMFGEMLTLLESDKRNSSEAIQLIYRNDKTERVYIPQNMYIIGTMNIADRSLALVDFALRRRFAFINLEPALGDTWLNWVIKNCGIDRDILLNIQDRLNALNEKIAADPSLGRQFQVGHSFVTPPADEKVSDPNNWFRQIVATEIYPLLEEYWFDDPDKALEAGKSLLEGI